MQAYEDKTTYEDSSIDQLFLQDKNPRESHDFKEKVNVYNIGDDDGEEEESSQSRKFTPNPWDIYHKRMKLKEMVGQQQMVKES